MPQIESVGLRYKWLKGNEFLKEKQPLNNCFRLLI